MNGSFFPRSFSLVRLCAVSLVCTSPLSAAEVIVKASADLQVNEYNGGAQNTGSNGVQLNARYKSDTVNEVTGLRFDLTGYDRSQITAARLELVNYRANSVRILHYWAVNDGAAGVDLTIDPAEDGPYTDNDWVEGSSTRFSTMPGLEYDADPATPGINTSRTVDLGSQTMNSAAEGTACTYDAAALADFLRTHPDDLVTLLISVDTQSTGQSRFASKEATGLQSGGEVVTAGTYAPRLVLEIGNNSVDRDGDGLLNTWEIQYGFDPDSADSDGDTLPDGEEDNDGDGLENLGEQQLGSDPLNPDTDSDTLSDLVETDTGIWVSEDNRGTSPLLADSDLDSLPDSVENPDLPFLGDFQPGTDPNKADTDGDLYSDPAELARGSQPDLASSVPDGAVLTILGTGTASLLGGDLTDPENDIDDTSPEGLNFNWVSVEASVRPFFGTGVQQDPTSQGAFGVFDNKLGPVNDKWYADSLPASLTVEFADPVSLTHFTVSSPDDSPQRDPVDWQILGSNDGVDFMPIFTQTDPLRRAIFSSRYQVIRCDLAEPSQPWKFIRYECTLAGSSQMMLGELELFGAADGVDTPAFAITGLARDAATGTLSLTWDSAPGEFFRIEYGTGTDAFPGVVVDNLQAASDAASTSLSFANPQAGASRLFFRVVRK